MTHQKNKPWFKFEEDMQALFDLQAQPGSGNQWHSVGDGVTAGHYSESKWPLMIDCKHTVQKSYTVNRKLMDQWVRTAQSEGKRFALPIRFEETGELPHTRSDYVVVPTNDYAELVASVTEGEPIDAPPRLNRQQSDFMHRIAQALKNPDQQREFLGILAKVEGA